MMCAQCSPPTIMFSSLRGSPTNAVKVPSPLAVRGMSSRALDASLVEPSFIFGPTVPSSLDSYRSGRTPGPPPKTESRSSFGVRVLRETSGFWGTPSRDVWSNVMSWSVNWPTNVEPAVIVTLSGLVP